MALTRQQIEDKLTAILERKILKELVWSDLTRTIGSLNQTKKDSLLRDIVEGRDEIVGRVLRKEMNQEVRVKARTEAVSIMADDMITFTELERLL